MSEEIEKIEKATVVLDKKQYDEFIDMVRKIRDERAELLDMLKTSTEVFLFANQIIGEKAKKTISEGKDLSLFEAGAIMITVIKNVKNNPAVMKELSTRFVKIKDISAKYIDTETQEKLKKLASGK